jgi:hypothetical protein
MLLIVKCSSRSSFPFVAGSSRLSVTLEQPVRSLIDIPDIDSVALREPARQSHGFVACRSSELRTARDLLDRERTFRSRIPHDDEVSGLGSWFKTFGYIHAAGWRSADSGVSTRHFDCPWKFSTVPQRRPRIYR